MLQFWRHRCKEPKKVDLRKVIYQINTLTDVIRCIEKELAITTSLKGKAVLIEKMQKLLSNKAWFSALYHIEVTQKQDQLKKENLEYCLCCDIIKEYAVSFCASPELRCEKNLAKVSSLIDEYKESL